jgi:signal transduction histidine kinase
VTVPAWLRVRWPWIVAFSSVAVTVALAAVYLDAAQAHRVAIRRAAEGSAERLLRTVVDSVEADLAFGLVPLFRRARETAIAGAPFEPAELEALSRLADSLARCECGPAVAIRSVSIWRPASRHLLTEPGSRLGAIASLLAMVDSSETRSKRIRGYLMGDQLFTVLGESATAPAMVHLLPLTRQSGRPTALMVEVDVEWLASRAARRLRSTVARSVTHGDPAGARATLAFRVGKWPGIVVDGPAHSPGVEATWEGEAPTISQGISATLTMSPALVALSIPGGLPRSPWPLAVGIVVLSLALTVSLLIALYRAERLGRMRTQFVFSVTHELRTPVTQILLYGETLQLGRQTPEAKGRAADVIVREARRLSLLIDNTLAFTRGQRPRAAPVASIDLGAAVQAIAAEIEPLVTQERATLRVTGQPNLAVAIDEQSLRQIVNNLVENAAIHGPPNQTIDLTVGVDGSHAILEIADRGAGIPAGLRRKIWEPFVRGPTGRSTGTGLGLSIVRDLVANHHGKVEILDREGGGARVVVTLPLDRASPTPPNGSRA